MLLLPMLRACCAVLCLGAASCAAQALTSTTSITHDVVLTPNETHYRVKVYQDAALPATQELITKTKAIAYSATPATTPASYKMYLTDADNMFKLYAEKADEVNIIETASCTDRTSGSCVRKSTNLAVEAAYGLIVDSFDHEFELDLTVWTVGPSSSANFSVVGKCSTIDVDSSHPVSVFLLDDEGLAYFEEGRNFYYLAEYACNSAQGESICRLSLPPMDVEHTLLLLNDQLHDEVQLSLTIVQPSDDECSELLPYPAPALEV